MNSKYGALNNVSAENQLANDKCVQIFQNSGDCRILFVGNSITKHGPAPEIGWNGNWGMAASCEEKDYVHLVMKALDVQKTDFCIAQCSAWECNYTEAETVLNEKFVYARDFDANIIVVRIGENIKFKGDTAELKESFEKMISFFNKSGKAKVVLTNLFWKQIEINKIIEDVAMENNYTLCDISDLESDEKTMALGKFEHQGISVHPGDLGMECIAERILKCINLQ